MNKNNKTIRLFYFKRLVLLHKLNSGTLPNDEKLQSSLLASLSVRQFRKLLKKHSPLGHCCSSSFEVLLTDDQKEKFEVYCQAGCPYYTFNQAIWEKGTDKQIYAMLASINKNNLIDEQLVAHDNKFFTKFVKDRGVHVSLFKKLVEREQEDLLLFCFRECPSEDFDIDEDDAAALFRSFMNKAKEEFIRVCDKLPAEAVIFALNSGNIELCRLVLRKRFILTKVEQQALFAVGNNELIILAVKKMNKETGLVLDDAGDYFLIKSGCTEAISLYLSQNRTLSCLAEKALIASGNRELIRKYLSYNDLSEEAASLLFAGTADELKTEFAEKYGLPYAVEADFIRHGKDEEVIAYLRKRALASGFNEALLMQRDTCDAAKFYYEEWILTELALTLLMKRGPVELREFFVEKKLREKDPLPHDSEVFFVVKGSSEQIIRYFQLFQLSDDSVAALLNRGDMELLNRYQRRHPVTDEALQLFAKNGSFTALTAFFREFNFPDSAEIALVERKDKDLIKSYFSLYDFGEEAEIKLLELDIQEFEDVILSYLDKHELSRGAEDDLFYLNNRKLMDTYYKNHCPSPDAHDLLVHLC